VGAQQTECGRAEASPQLEDPIRESHHPPVLAGEEEDHFPSSYSYPKPASELETGAASSAAGGYLGQAKRTQVLEAVGAAVAAMVDPYQGILVFGNPKRFAEAFVGVHR
jgi:hypothetical protein